MKNKLTKIMNHSIAYLILFFVFFPLLWAIISTFKDKTEVFATPLKLFPSQFNFDNFSRVFYLQYTSLGINFLQSLLMTFVVATLAVIGSLTLNMMAAYALARLDYKFKKFLWVYYIVTMFIPAITILLTSVQVVAQLGMMNTIWVLILPGLVNAYNIFFFRQFFYGIPQSIEEAAMIDGASRFGIFSKIFLPMSTTPMVIIGATVFMGYWNNYLWPSITVAENKNLYQVMIVIRALFADYRELGYGSVLAATLLTMIGPLLIFAIAQRKIVDGIAITGLK